ncbi:hypothetical protein LSH36_2895g00001 [Paralvinella palmiformis]|uniref:Sulfotransferase n=1 Tax=Paralvinella palmiformis TaxID=53620 RepID=A0AAD9IQQ2_9ANNE|nr:hypothetical protein LSH36_2895g00001 [Paralvinella palmiformis]
MDNPKRILTITISIFLFLTYKGNLEHVTVTFTNASELMSGTSNSTSMKAYQQNYTTISHQHKLTVGDENEIHAGYLSMEVTEEAIETFSVGRKTPKVNCVIGGLNHVYLEDWLSVFPRSQCFYIKSEEYFYSKKKTLLRIFDFLGTSHSSPPREILECVDAFPPTHRSVEAEMTNDTRKMLEDFFRPHERALELLLEDDRWRWN